MPFYSPQIPYGLLGLTPCSTNQITNCTHCLEIHSKKLATNCLNYATALLLDTKLTNSRFKVAGRVK
jgi:hypothetical protein